MKKILPITLILLLLLPLLSGCASKPAPITSKSAPVMTVGGTEISALEYNFTYDSQVQNFYSSYSDYLSYFGIDKTKPLKEQPCTVLNDGSSWADYFMTETEEMLTQVFTFYNAARARNMELTEEYTLQVDAFVLSANEAAVQAKMSLDDYLAEYYGAGMTEKHYREFLSRRLLSTQYCDEYFDSREYSEQEYESYYSENRDAIDLVNFRVYTLNETFLSSGQEGATEAETVAAVKALADAFAEGLTDEEIFKARAVEYAPADEKENYVPDSATLAKNISKEDLAEGTMSQWLFDKTRKPGDVSVHETASGSYTVCFFLSLQRDENPLVSMRHLLLSVTENEDGTDDSASVKTAIEDLYIQWEQAGKTEESFISLAQKHTQDPGSKENGGLYENFSKGTMVSEIDTWLYDDRKEGDSAVIKTSFGYHIVWFLGYGEIAWKSQCLSGLQDKDYFSLLDSLKEQNPVTYAENHRTLVGNDY